MARVETLGVGWVDYLYCSHFSSAHPHQTTLFPHVGFCLQAERASKPYRELRIESAIRIATFYKKVLIRSKARLRFK